MHALHRMCAETQLDSCSQPCAAARDPPRALLPEHIQPWLLCAAGLARYREVLTKAQRRRAPFFMVVDRPGLAHEDGMYYWSVCRARPTASRACSCDEVVSCRGVHVPSRQRPGLGAGAGYPALIFHKGDGNHARPLQPALAHLAPPCPGRAGWSSRCLTCSSWT